VTGDPLCTGPKCGTNAGYTQHTETGTKAGRPCMDAHALRKAAYRARRYLARGPMRVDSTGTRRRLQALAVMGWPSEAIGARLGVQGRVVAGWRYGPRVDRSTAARVARLYDELWDKRGPSNSTAVRARNKGWLPPLAWNDEDLDRPDARPSRMTEYRPAMDEIAVERAMRGSEVHLLPAERAEVVRRLTEAGLSAQEIARRAGITSRTVVRRRAKGRAA
jgi:hypothetical protein